MAAMLTETDIRSKSCLEDDRGSTPESPNTTGNSDESTIPHKKYKCYWGEFETPLYYGNIIAITLLHIMTVYGILIHLFTIHQHIWEICYGTILGGVGGFGITAGAHRLWTHRCYKAKLPLQLILLFCYSVAGQNTILEWVRDHRVHHKFSETDADPHNVNRGFFFSHVGWLMMKKHPEVYRKGKSVDLSDITSDPLLMFHIKYWAWFRLVFCYILPVLIPPLMFGRPWQTAIYTNIVRYCLNLNFTWSVNSFAHIYGNKPYNKEIQPVENPIVSLVAMGEGWHNYHHCFPWDYRAAEIGSSLNVTTFWLDLFAKVGWAYDLKTASPDLVENLAKKKGDGTHIKKLN